jgi:hypothetical protein
VFVRPLRWLFWKMCWASHPRWRFDRLYPGGPMRYPNIHWYVLYVTVFRFCAWLYWDAWRAFAVWKDRGEGYRWLRRHTWLSRMIQTIGRGTAGYTISGGSCPHCGSREGDPVELSQSDDYFELLETWASSTMDGTDHRFRGLRLVPVVDIGQSMKMVPCNSGWLRVFAGCIWDILLFSAGSMILLSIVSFLKSG